MQFQAVCSKWNKKLTLSLSASSREEAREILHKQGYSIIEIQEVLDTSLLQEGNFFYFDIVNNGNVQMGKIQSDDIFKAYRKLVEDLKYNVISIYTTPETSEEQKKIITAKVKDGYNMYLESIGWKVEEKVEQKNMIDDDATDFSPQLLKELEKYWKIVDDTITKIQNLLIQNHEHITEEQKALLEHIETDLVQIKGVRNVWKMQSTLEESLKKIGAVEVEMLKKGMIAEKQKFLAETNKLLQGVWSSEKIQTEEEKKKDIGYQLGELFGKISAQKTPEEKPKETQKLDTNSFIYYKNKRELDIYKKAQEKNNKAILSAIFGFKFSSLRRLFLKKRLLSQNIQIIENRISNKVVSYTKIAHGMEYYVDVFFNFINNISILLALALFLYSVSYILLNISLSLHIFSFSLNEKSPLFLALFSVFTFVLSFIRGWKTLIFGAILLFFLFSFLSLNF